MKIPIVNENDEIVGEEERSLVHQKGILHREIHVWFITPDNKIIFQKRGMNKETYPGLLDATVGGHVDSANHTYEETAERESYEETGVDVRGKLIEIEKTQSKSFDKVTNLVNNAFKTIYAYVFYGNISELKIEDKNGLGFESYSLEDIENLNEEQKKNFISSMVS